MRRNPGIARVFPLHHAGQIKLRRQLHRHILEAVHRNIGAILLQSQLQLFDKQAFAANFGERAIQYLIAARGHGHQLYAVPQFLQAVLHMLSLPHGQATFSGSDSNLHKADVSGRAAARLRRNHPVMNTLSSMLA